MNSDDYTSEDAKKNGKEDREDNFKKNKKITRTSQKEKNDKRRPSHPNLYDVKTNNLYKKHKVRSKATSARIEKFKEKT